MEKPKGARRTPNPVHKLGSMTEAGTAQRLAHSRVTMEGKRGLNGLEALALAGAVVVAVCALILVFAYRPF